MTISRLNTEKSARLLPKRVVRPCESGLKLAICNMEKQLGTIEAYNMLADYAARMKAQIDAGKAKKQLEFYATDTQSGN